MEGVVAAQRSEIKGTVNLWCRSLAAEQVRRPAAPPPAPPRSSR